MPYVHEVQLNLVQVNVLKESVCLHNDHNSGIRNKFQLLEQLKETINFHIAITESNHDNAPFVIWVESKNEIITPRYCYKYL